MEMSLLTFKASVKMATFFCTTGITVNTKIQIFHSAVKKDLLPYIF